jgi:sec-independent protein translocase protein TatB
MFDFSFWELATVGGVALVVLGPEKLPAIARAIGRALHRLQRVKNILKDEIDQQLKLEQLKINQAKAEAVEKNDG